VVTKCDPVDSIEKRAVINLTPFPMMTEEPIDLLNEKIRPRGDKKEGKGRASAKSLLQKVKSS